MIRCSCGTALTYETDICPVCLPYGVGAHPPLVIRTERLIDQTVQKIMNLELEALGDHCLAVNLRTIILSALTTKRW